jgi:hypothetical protein
MRTDEELKLIREITSQLEMTIFAIETAREEISSRAGVTPGDLLLMSEIFGQLLSIKINLEKRQENLTDPELL